MKGEGRYIVQGTGQRRDTGQWVPLEAVRVERWQDWKRVVDANAPEFRYQSVEVVDEDGEVVAYHEEGHGPAEGYSPDPTERLQNRAEAFRRLAREVIFVDEHAKALGANIGALGIHRVPRDVFWELVRGREGDVNAFPGDGKCPAFLSARVRVRDDGRTMTFFSRDDGSKA